MGFKIRGGDRLERRITSTALFVTKEAQKALLQKANDIHETAVKMAPIDDGYLEESIKMDVSEGGKVTRVYVDENVAAAGRKVVGDYAFLVHEGIPTDAGYGKTEKSQAKQAAVGEDVGPGYLERAVQKHTKETFSAVRSVIKRALNLFSLGRK